MLTLKVIKSVDQRHLLRDSRGGNKQLPTFAGCPHSASTFGPLGQLARRYCSMECKARAQATGRRVQRKSTRKARTAQNLVRHQIAAGNLVRPMKCEECGAGGRKIEAAHYDYDQPLYVRWLCRSCHVRWDKRNPKQGTFVVGRVSSPAEVAT